LSFFAVELGESWRIGCAISVFNGDVVYETKKRVSFEAGTKTHFHF
jgi:hypothetical protein